MKLWAVLARPLAMLAVVSLLIVPVATPSVAMGIAPAVAMEDAASMSDGMPCCPHQNPVDPKCPKSCPLAALCMAASLLYAPESSAVLPVRFAVTNAKSPGNDAEPECLTEPPPLRPPRT